LVEPVSLGACFYYAAGFLDFRSEFFSAIEVLLLSAAVDFP
jgi:hypothetical protein